jgi:hypothetical protein
MTLYCPCCGSTRVETRDRARRVAAGLGALAGGLNKFPTPWRDPVGWLSNVGPSAALVAIPGVPLRAKARAALYVFAGAAAGCAAGAALGSLLDANVLKNRRCLACGHKFSEPGYGLSTARYQEAARDHTGDPADPVAGFHDHD